MLVNIPSHTFWPRIQSHHGIKYQIYLNRFRNKRNTQKQILTQQIQFKKKAPFHACRPSGSQRRAWKWAGYLHINTAAGIVIGGAHDTVRAERETIFMCKFHLHVQGTLLFHQHPLSVCPTVPHSQVSVDNSAPLPPPLPSCTLHLHVFNSLFFKAAQT